jgi:hypothetical protein
MNYDLIISFGYRHIISKEIIKSVNCPIINLHISYLPYNRGAHPNFWSFYDKTPSGVTIHLVNEGIDTGPIIYQRHIIFDNNEKMRMSAFVDAGNVYEKSSNIKLGDIRMSTGFAFAYLSPIGSIGAYISTPIVKKSGDTIESFGFSLGTGF